MKHVSTCDGCKRHPVTLELFRVCRHAGMLLEQIKERRQRAGANGDAVVLTKEFDLPAHPILGWKSAQLWREEDAKPGPVYRPLEK